MPAAAWQIDVWRKLAEKARSGEVVFAASCTQMTYVERIPAGQPGRAMSTRHVLEMATSVTLEPPGTEYHSGGLHLYSDPSKDIDHDAHVAQQRVRLPAMLKEHVGGVDVAVDDAPGESIFGFLGRRLKELGRVLVDGGGVLFVGRPSLGERALAVAIKEIGVKETPGPGNTARVVEFLKVCIGRPERGAAASGRPLGLADDSFAWCAAFASWCMVQACNESDALPHEPRAAVWELVADARERGTFRDVSTGYRPKPGDLRILKRAGGDPRIPGQSGHVDRVETIGAETCVCIGGNEADQVRREVERYDAADVAGYIAYP
jgi:hypothetical protein